MNKMKRNLSVPYFPQRENRYVWKEREPFLLRDPDAKKKNPNPKGGQIKSGGLSLPLHDHSCNITSLIMVLHYMGATQNSPDYYLEKIFNPKDSSYDILKSNLRQNGYPLGEDDLIPHEVIEHNRFAKPFVETFFPGSGISCRTQWGELQKTMEEQVVKGLPAILFVGTTAKVFHFDAFDVEKEAGKDPLRTFLENHTSSDADTRIDWGEGLDYQELLRCKTTYDEALGLIKGEEATEEEKVQARESIKTLREKINDAKIARAHKHFVVVRGFTEDEVIINDPWGRPAMDENGRVLLDRAGRWDYYDRQRASPFGDNIRIQREDFQKRYTDDGSCFLWLLERKSLWDFVYPRVLPKERKPEYRDYLACYDQEEAFWGGYPIRNALTWHTGIHIKGERKAVCTMGPGRLVAARIQNGSDPEQRFNGSRCFVLLKHHFFVDGEMKSFYSLYYHLAPVLFSSSGPVALSEPEWFKSLQSRCFPRAIASHNTRLYNAATGAKIGKLAKNASVKIEDIAEKEIEGRKVQTLVHTMNGRRVHTPLGDFRTVYNPLGEELELYREKVRLLEQGEIAYFDDLPSWDDAVEVGSGQILGLTDRFYGYDSLDPRKGENLVHWEVFSEELLFPSPEAEGFVVEDCSSQGSDQILNARGIVEMLKASEAFSLGVFKMLEDDGVISPEEFHSFYLDPRVRLGMADYIYVGASEWSAPIDWDLAYEKAVGFCRHGQSIATEEGGRYFPKSDYIAAFRAPHQWFDRAMVQAMAPVSDRLFREGRAVYYHPIRLLQWLQERDWA